MMFGRVVAVVLFLASILPAQAQRTYPSAPPGKWKWYYGLFNDVGAFVAPTIYWGSATLTIKGTSIRIDMQPNPPLYGKPLYFEGRIDANNHVDGVFHGIFTEEDPPAMQGHYRKMRWSKNSICATETILLEEKFRNENVMVFRKGSRPGC